MVAAVAAAAMAISAVTTVVATPLALRLKMATVTMPWCRVCEKMVDEALGDAPDPAPPPSSYTGHLSTDE